MAGPYPPNQPVGAESQPFAGQPGYPDQPQPYPVGYPGQYPGQLPPPIEYPPRKRSLRPLWWTVGALALVGVLVAAVVLLTGIRKPGTGTGAFSDTAARSAIQGYLTALSDGDTETVARNNACGMFDAVKERRSDLALARLASDAFRKQFTQAEVTSIDKIVLSSSYQAQVLFTMRVAPAAGSRNARDQQQGVAQLLRQDNQLLVCSYLLRTAAQF
ncbi:MAG TPA: hypothetical protein PKK01_07650 [Mycobacterium sp.]|nr:MAG: hypothetical protein E6R06_05215 [Mycobacterium sp.]HOB49178.1 hypothetical protein [Mycobacterium sp.]HPZ95574.1 hypothetical protein [Mycobacterium sp.]HQE14294.1 hypothetical protein [Mycobacterium sp.]